MTTHSAPLDEAVTELRIENRSLHSYIRDRYDQIESIENDIHAWVNGAKPQSQIDAEANALEHRYPDPKTRPPLYGTPVGVKDIIHVEGLPTYAGSTLPPSRLVDSEATIVTRLREAGALILGKTVTTEFAYFEPGDTRNPHNIEHTPGGSSSGSAAAVAAGMCPLALGTQTVGSVIRPASYCGIIGYKPSFGRIPTDGIIPLSKSVDHVGLFTQDVAGMKCAASVCVDNWNTSTIKRKPILGIPDDRYLNQSTNEGLSSFESSISKLKSSGYEVIRTKVLEEIKEINTRHNRLVAAEAAIAHDDWFEEFTNQYSEKTIELISEGQIVDVVEVINGRRGRRDLRQRLHEAMNQNRVDIWISPSAPGTAPKGIENTGNPVMNLPWTHAGVPTVTIPTKRIDGLPLGMQCAGRFGDDERLITWCDRIKQELAL